LKDEEVEEEVIDKEKSNNSKQQKIKLNINQE
jgi:hypothetical protein